MKLLYVFMLLSATFSIKIRIKTPKKDGGYSQTPAPGGWSTSRSCNPIAPGIQMGTLFSIYAEQLYKIFNDPVNQLLLVKHESQVVAGANHRLIFRVMDRQTRDKLYIGMSLFVDLQGGVRVTGYLESFELRDIVSALGFSNGRLFKYRCPDLNKQAVAGFEDWARNLGGCQSGGGFDDLGGFNSGDRFSRESSNSFNDNSGSQFQGNPNDPFGGDDSPFDTKEININIRGRHPDGTPFLIGSKRPSKKP